MVSSVVEVRRRWDPRNMQEIFPDTLIMPVLNMYHDRQIDFIVRQLNLNELSVVKDTADYLPAAAVAAVDDEKLKFLEHRFRKVDMKHYLGLQKRWISDERYYLGEKLCHPVNDSELVEDFERNNFGLRFSALYIFRYLRDKTKVRHA